MRCLRQDLRPGLSLLARLFGRSRRPCPIQLPSEFPLAHHPVHRVHLLIGCRKSPGLAERAGKNLAIVVATLSKHTGNGRERVEHVDERHQERRAGNPVRVLRSADGALRSQPVGPTPQKLATELRDGVVPVLQKQVTNLCPFVVGEVQPVPNSPREVDAVRTHVGDLGDRTVAPQLLAPLGCRRCSDPQCVIDLRARRPVGPGPLEHPLAHLRPQRFPEQVEVGPLGRVHRQESFGDAIDHHAGLVDPG